MNGSVGDSWLLKSPDRPRNFLFSPMPSKPAILGQAHSPPCSVPNVSRGFDRKPGQGVFPTCKQVTALGRAPKEPMSWPTKSTRAPHTQRVPRPPPCPSAKCCAVFSPNRRTFLCRGWCSVRLSCTPTCSAISPRVTGPAVQMKATPTRISLTHQLALCRGRFSCKSNL